MQMKTVEGEEFISKKSPCVINPCQYVHDIKIFINGPLGGGELLFSAIFDYRSKTLAL